MHSSESQVPAMTNWAGNISFSAARFHRPASVGEVQQIVGASKAVRALGTGHSFNRIADTTGDLISITDLPRIIEVDSQRSLVRVSGGIRYGEVGGQLAAAGLALSNTGSLLHISVAGACATGTHGSGVGNPNLSDAVQEITMVVPSGDLVTVGRDTAPDEFSGSVLALGRLGIITELTLRIVPGFEVSQTVLEDVPDDQVGTHLLEILSSAYSVSIFTSWNPMVPQRIWRKARVLDDNGFHPKSVHPKSVHPKSWGGRPATVAHNPLPGMPAEHATQQLGVPGPWNERLPHFRLNFTPSSGEELQSEYLLPLELAGPAWAALSEIRQKIALVLQIGEIRTVARDSMWISPCTGQDSVAFHFTWIPNPAVVLPVVTAIERQLAPFRARPHWGKVFTTSPEALANLYPRLGDFHALAQRYDPTNKLGNEEVDNWFRAVGVSCR